MSQLRTAQSFSDKVDVTLRLVAWLDARERLDQAGSPEERRVAFNELSAWAGRSWPPRGPRCRGISATAAWAT